MKNETFEQLKGIFDKYERTKEFGKLCQQLVALALNLADFKVTEVRLVEGVDIDALYRQSEEKYAIEVKTTVGNSIEFKPKDADGLLRRKEDSYQPVLAVLRLDRFSQWMFAKADSIKPGSVYIDKLRVYRLAEIEKRISPFFDKTVSDHYAGTMRDGQRYLNDVLRQKGVKVRQS